MGLPVATLKVIVPVRLLPTTIPRHSVTVRIKTSSNGPLPVNVTTASVPTVPVTGIVNPIPPKPSGPESVLPVCVGVKVCAPPPPRD